LALRLEEQQSIVERRQKTGESAKTTKRRSRILSAHRLTVFFRLIIPRLRDRGFKSRPRNQFSGEVWWSNEACRNRSAAQNFRAQFQVAIQRSSVVERSAVNLLQEHFRARPRFPSCTARKRISRGKTGLKCAITNASHVIRQPYEQYHMRVTMTFGNASPTPTRDVSALSTQRSPKPAERRWD
jgi:hypothetical protein